MIITINGEHEEYNNTEFLSYVLDTYVDLLMKNISIYKLKPAQDCINLSNMYRVLLYPRRRIDVLDVIRASTMHLNIYWANNRITIILDKNSTVYSTGLKIDTVCRLVEFGCIGVPAYPIYNHVAKYIEDNLESIYTRFILGRALI